MLCRVICRKICAASVAKRISSINTTAFQLAIEADKELRSNNTPTQQVQSFRFTGSKINELLKSETKQLIRVYYDLLNSDIKLNNEYLLNSLHTEILWRMRSMRLTHLCAMLGSADSSRLKQAMPDARAEKLVSNAVQIINRRWAELENVDDLKAIFSHSSHFDPDLLTKVESRAIDLVPGLSSHDKVGLLCLLAEQKLRPTPLLRALVFYLAQESSQLTLRQMTNAIHALCSMSFPDELFLERISECLTADDPEMKARLSEHVSAVLTPIGKMQWRSPALLDHIANLLVSRLAVCSTRDLVSYVLTLARVNYQPHQADRLFDHILQTVNQESVKSSEIWLDFVWSLAVLNRCESSHALSVLNQDFISKLLVDESNVAIRQKLLNINAYGNLVLDLNCNLASLICTDEELSKYEPSRRKSSKFFNKSVTETAKFVLSQPNALLIDNYTPLGVFINVECFVDKTQRSLKYEDLIGSADSASSSERGFQHKLTLPPNIYRLAIVAREFKDFTLGSRCLNGICTLEDTLLRRCNYTVIGVNFDEFSTKDPVAKRAEHLGNVIAESFVRKWRF